MTIWTIIRNIGDQDEAQAIMSAVEEQFEVDVELVEEFDD